MRAFLTMIGATALLLGASYLCAAQYALDYGAPAHKVEGTLAWIMLAGYSTGFLGFWTGCAALIALGIWAFACKASP